MFRIRNVFRRRQNRRNLDSLSRKVVIRLREESDALAAEELHYQKVLNLPIRPLLVLVDEESTSVLTAADRERMERGERQ